MTSYESQYPCQYSIFRTTCLTYIRHNIYSVILQKLRHEFKKLLHEMAVGSQSAEKEPQEVDSTEPHSASPTHPLFTLTAYSKLYAIVYRRGRINTW